MALQITILDDAPPLTVTDDGQLNEVLQRASEEARGRKVLGAIVIEANTGNLITIIVGGGETVLGFNYGNRGPYYASRGTSDADAPLMTCFLTMQHHTEFPRKYVIPVAD